MSSKFMGLALFTCLTSAALTGCRPADTSRATAELGFIVSELVFARTGLGEERALTVSLENRGRAFTEVSLSAAEPFSVKPSSAEIYGGGTVQVTVTFRPTIEGETNGVLQAASLDGSAQLGLSGSSVRSLNCAASSPCVSSVFDVESGRCVEMALADGSACASASSCIAQGLCVGGVCKGELTTCDDGNACTTDACAVGEGCVHFDVSAQCPAASDACHAPVCDPRQGCQTVELADGTPCGPSDCNTADLCMAGICNSVPAPEGSSCGAGSPCQAKGVCREKTCVQPAATPLFEA